MTIITGGVQSRVARTTRVLAPNSLYHPVASEYARRVQHSQESAMPTDAFARSIVSQLLYGPAPWRWLRPWFLPAYTTPKSWIWEGHKTPLLWLLTGGWAWWGLFDGVFTRMFNLWKLRGTMWWIHWDIASHCNRNGEFGLDNGISGSIEIFQRKLLSLIVLSYYVYVFIIIKSIDIIIS